MTLIASGPTLAERRRSACREVDRRSDGDREVNEVFFTDVKVPVDNLVGEENKGWTCAKYLLTYERTGIAGVGFSMAALEKLKVVASKVHRNGKPLSQDPLFATRMAKVEIDLENMKTTNLRVIAAVAGFALGGGCELAMMCDFIIAADNAKFGQPEIKIGIIPGAGGTQRLPRAIGKSKAMDLVLTARMMDATEAERAGLVSRVVPLDKLMDEALGAALMICGYGQLSVMAAKESVNRAFESGLSDGVMFERRMFHGLFATNDQKEGMDAFLNKRAPNFTHS